MPTAPARRPSIGASLLVAAAVALGSLGCGDRPPPSPAASLPPPVPTSPPDSRDHEVVAVVEEIRDYGRKERAQDGSVRFSTVVALAVVEPRRLPERLAAYTYGMPAVAGRPLVLGDRLRFTLPEDYGSGDLHLLELPSIRFADPLTAVVERIDMDGYVELLPDGKRWSNLVTLRVVGPRQGMKPIQVYSHELAIGTRSLRVGDQLSFVMPALASPRPLHLSELEKLRFRN